MHFIGLCSGVCFQFCLGPCENDQRFLLGIYFTVLLLALHLIYAQGFNHLFPFLFSHLKLTPGCSQVPQIITLELRLLVSMDWNPHNGVGTPKTGYILGFPKDQLTHWFYMIKVRKQRVLFFILPKVFTMMNSTATNLTSRVNLSQI